MEMDVLTFRWILIIAGVVIVAGIFLFGNPDRKRKSRASRKRVHAKRVRQEPALDSENQVSDGSVTDGDAWQAELAIDAPPDDGAGSDASPEKRIEPRLDSKPKHTTHAAMCQCGGCHVLDTPPSSCTPGQ